MRAVARRPALSPWSGRIMAASLGRRRAFVTVARDVRDVRDARDARDARGRWALAPRLLLSGELRRPCVGRSMRRLVREGRVLRSASPRSLATFRRQGPRRGWLRRETFHGRALRREVLRREAFHGGALRREVLRREAPRQGAPRRQGRCLRRARPRCLPRRLRWPRRRLRRRRGFRTICAKRARWCGRRGRACARATAGARSRCSRRSRSVSGRGGSAKSGCCSPSKRSRRRAGVGRRRRAPRRCCASTRRARTPTVCGRSSKLRGAMRTAGGRGHLPKGSVRFNFGGGASVSRKGLVSCEAEVWARGWGRAWWPWRPSGATPSRRVWGGVPTVRTRAAAAEWTGRARRAPSRTRRAAGRTPLAGRGWPASRASSTPPFARPPSVRAASRASGLVRKTALPAAVARRRSRARRAWCFRAEALLPSRSGLKSACPSGLARRHRRTPFSPSRPTLTLFQRTPGLRFCLRAPALPSRRSTCAAPTLGAKRARARSS
jgi:hypothetical protein